MKWILVFLTLPLFASNWSLTDPDKGWNEDELIRLYFHHSELQRQWAWEALSQYRFRGDEEVLDFGAGDGKITAMISFMVPNGSVVGIDISQQMVDFASKMFPPTFYPNLSYQRSVDGTFDGDNFDLVTSFCAFHLIPNPREIFSSIRSRMSPDGHLVLTLPIGGNPDFFAVLMEELALRDWSLPPPSSDTRRMRSPDGLEEILTGAGFEIDYLKVVDTRTPFSSEKEFIDWMEGTLSANWNIPVDQRREFFESFSERYFNRCPHERDDDGFVYFSIKRIDLVAHPSLSHG